MYTFNNADHNNFAYGLLKTIYDSTVSHKIPKPKVNGTPYILKYYKNPTKLVLKNSAAGQFDTATDLHISNLIISIKSL